MNTQRINNTGNTIIQVKNLTRIYNIRDGNNLRDRQLLYRNMSFTVAEGEFVAIVGPSGCGKTTLLNIIGGLDSLKDKKILKLYDAEAGKEIHVPEAEGDGEIFIDNQDISKLKGNRKAEFINRSIGFIFQFHHLIPELTALQNVALPMRIQGKSVKEANRRAHELLAEMEMGKDIDKKPAVLSGGEKQRVAIARALINNPKILLADEPTGSLHLEKKEEIIELFCKMNRERNVTVLLVTHDRKTLYDKKRKLRVNRLFKLPVEEQNNVAIANVFELECPNCNEILTMESVQGAGTKAFLCHHCKGIWLDHRQLHHLDYQSVDFQKYLEAQDIRKFVNHN